MAQQHQNNNLVLAQALAGLAMIGSQQQQRQAGNGNGAAAMRRSSSNPTLQIEEISEVDVSQQQQALQTSASSSGSGAQAAGGTGASPGQQLMGLIRGIAGCNAPSLPQALVDSAGGTTALALQQSQPVQPLDLMTTLAGLMQQPQPEEPAVAPKKKQRKAPSGATSAKRSIIQGPNPGGPVEGRYVDFSKGHLEGCDAEVWTWTLSTELSLNKNYESKLLRIIRDTGKRKQICNDPCNAGNPDASSSADECDKYEIMFTAIIQINQVWMDLPKFKNPDATVNAIDQLHNTLDSQPLLRSIWQRGQRVPLYQRERLLRIKVTFVAKQFPVILRNITSLINAESCEEACPESVASRMPEAHASYTPRTQQKAEYLRAYWAPGELQFRLWEHSCKQLYIYQVKSLEQFYSVYANFCLSIFPQLADATGAPKDQDKTAAAAAEPAEKKARTEDGKVDKASAESDAFEDFQFNLEAFESACLPEGERQRRQDINQLISEKSRDQALWVCSLVWPEKFKSSLDEALKQYSLEVTPAWIKTMQGCSHFVNLARLRRYSMES